MRLSAEVVNYVTRTWPLTDLTRYNNIDDGCLS